MKLHMGETIRRSRRAIDLTQEQLAEILGVSVQSVSRWETDTTYPDMETVPELAAALGISVDVLFGRTEEQKIARTQEVFDRLYQTLDNPCPDSCVDILKQIRCELHNNSHYDTLLMPLFMVISGRKLNRNEKIMAELRLLTKEIGRTYPRRYLDIAVKWMSYLEDDEHIEDFINSHTSNESMTKLELYLERYSHTKEYDKREPLRMAYLHQQISNLVATPSNWNKTGFRSTNPHHTIWCNERNLAYLHSLRGISPEEAYPLTGNGKVDIWFDTFLDIGYKQIAALANIGATDRAFAMLEDYTCLLETIGSIREDHFTLTCDSPPFKGFEIQYRFEYHPDKEGNQHRVLLWDSSTKNMILHNYYALCINEFTKLESDPRYEGYMRRLEAAAL